MTRWQTCRNFSLVVFVVHSSVHLSLFIDYRTDNMDFDNYAHESSYGGHDPGMYSSDPYGQSYSPHLPNGGQYYQDERSPHGSRVSLQSGGSNRNLSRMVRNLPRVIKHFVASPNFLDDCNLTFFRITSWWARGRWDPYTEWSPPSPMTTTPPTPRCLAPSMMTVHPRAHHTARAPPQGLMAIRIRHTVAGGATVWRPMIAYTEMILTVVMILGS